MCEGYRNLIEDEDWNRLRVVVVPHQAIEATINRLAAQAGLEGEYRSRQGTPASAVTRPLTQCNQFEPTIVLAAELVAPLSDSFRAPAPAVLAMLEELLHVRIYAARYRRTGCVQLRVSDGGGACDVDLRTLAVQACDEYAVGRLKTTLVGQYEVAQRGPGAPLQTLQIRYDSSDDPSEDVWVERIQSTIRQAAAAPASCEVAWSTLLHCIYRGLLEPSARRLAYHDAKEQLTAALPEGIARFGPFRSRLPVIAANLRLVVESNLGGTEEAAVSVANELRLVLGDLGVTYATLDSGGCEVRFVPTPLR